MKHNSIKKFPVVRSARAIEYLIMVLALNLVPICMVIEGYRIQTVFKYVALVSELVFLLLDIFIFRKPVLLMFNFVYFDEAGVHCLRPFQRELFLDWSNCKYISFIAVLPGTEYQAGSACFSAHVPEKRLDGYSCYNMTDECIYVSPSKELWEEVKQYVSPKLYFDAMINSVQK